MIKLLQAPIAFFMVIYCLTVLPSCKKKKEDVVEPILETSVKGHAYHTYTHEPLANEKVSVTGIKRIYGNWTYNTTYTVVDSVFTDTAGYFELNFLNTLDADSFIVRCTNRDKSPYVKLNVGNTNTFDLYAHDYSVLIASFHVTNNPHPLLNIIPSSMPASPSFWIQPITIDTTVRWHAEPEKSYNVQYRSYDSTHTWTGYDFGHFSTGAFADTFYHQFIIEVDSFQ